MSFWRQFVPLNGINVIHFFLYDTDLFQGTTTCFKYYIACCGCIDKLVSMYSILILLVYEALALKFNFLKEIIYLFLFMYGVPLISNEEKIWFVNMNPCSDFTCES